MTTITQNICDVTGANDNTPWSFSSLLREQDGSIVTTRVVQVWPVNGVLTVELQPGPAEVAFRDANYSFTVPEEDSELWPLIAASVAFPPDTQADAVAAAVEAYLAANPPEAVVPVENITGAGTTGKLLLSAETAADVSEALNTTRTGVFTWALPNTLGGFSGNKYTMRRPFSLTQTPIRWRVHVMNRNQLNDSVGNTLTNVSIYVGEPELSSGEITGNFTDTPTQLQDVTTIESGNELVTDWTTYPLTPYRRYLLSIGFEAPSGLFGICGDTIWRTLDPDDAGVVAPQGISRMNNNAYLQMYIEYEFINGSAPVIFVVGNSLSDGANTDSIANMGTLSAWPQLWAHANGGVVAGIYVAGAWASHFPTSATGRWDGVYSTLATPLDVDAVVYMALCSSDIANAGNVSNSQTSMSNAILAGQQRYPDARHIITNVPPREQFTSGGREDGRLALNGWLHELPVGVEQCLDVDSLLTDWEYPARVRAAYDADGTHWLPRGHQRVAQLIPVKASNEKQRSL